MLFLEKENISKCFVTFQKMFWKIFSGVWLCFWKYQRKNIFSLLLTFSQLPNKYIISFLNIETQETKPRKKKFIKSGQYRNTKETKPRKKKFIKSGQIERRRKRKRGNWVWSRGEIERLWSRSLLDQCGAAINKTGGVWVVGLELNLWSLDWSSVWRLGSLSLSLCAWVWKWFEVKIFTSNTRSTENFHFKPFPGQSH